MIAEGTWILLIVWIIFFVLSWKLKEPIVTGLGGVIGLLVGIEFLSNINEILGLVFIVLSFYQFYVVAFTEAKA